MASFGTADVAEATLAVVALEEVAPALRPVKDGMATAAEVTVAILLVIVEGFLRIKKMNQEKRGAKWGLI